MKHMWWFLMCGVLLVIAALTQHSLWLRAQNVPPATSAYPSEEYLLLGDATRGAGEPMLAVDPTNPKNIIAVAMGNLHRLGGKTFTGNEEYHVTENSTITWLGVTHDGGLTWKVGELPILTGKYTDRKSTRLNSSHLVISYAVFCLKKKIQWHIANISNAADSVTERTGAALFSH